jgi:hypothetical protein
MSEATYENLVHDLYESEEKLSEESRIEYYRRKRFLEAALEQYIESSLSADECTEETARLLLKRRSLTYKFIIAAIAVTIICWIFELEIELCLLLTTLLLGYFGKTYIDIGTDDQGHSAEFFIAEFDKKRIERDLAGFGIDAQSLKQYQWDSYIKIGKNVSYTEYDPNSVSLGEIYMKQRILEKLSKE